MSGDAFVKGLNTTEGDRVFRWTGLNSRASVSNLQARKVRPDHILELENSEDGSYFNAELEHWKQLDLTINFKLLYSKVSSFSSLAQVLHHKNEIIDALLQALDTLAWKSTLSLIGMLAKDLTVELFPRYDDIINGLRMLINPQQPEKTAETFRVISFLFKYLGTEILSSPEFGAHFNSWTHYMGYKKVFIRELTASSLALLLRQQSSKDLGSQISSLVRSMSLNADLKVEKRLKSPNIVEGVELMINEVGSKRTIELRDGIAMLFFELIRGSNQGFYSKASKIMTHFLSTFRPKPSKYTEFAKSILEKSPSNLQNSEELINHFNSVYTVSLSQRFELIAQTLNHSLNYTNNHGGLVCFNAILSVLENAIRDWNTIDAGLLKAESMSSSLATRAAQLAGATPKVREKLLVEDAKNAEKEKDGLTLPLRIASLKLSLRAQSLYLSQLCGLLSTFLQFSNGSRAPKTPESYFNLYSVIKRIFSPKQWNSPHIPAISRALFLRLLSASWRFICMESSDVSDIYAGEYEKLGKRLEKSEKVVKVHVLNNGDSDEDMDQGDESIAGSSMLQDKDAKKRASTFIDVVFSLDTTADVPPIHPLCETLTAVSCRVLLSHETEEGQAFADISRAGHQASKRVIYVGSLRASSLLLSFSREIMHHVSRPSVRASGTVDSLQALLPQLSSFLLRGISLDDGATEEARGRRAILYSMLLSIHDALAPRGVTVELGSLLTADNRLDFPEMNSPNKHDKKPLSISDLLMGDLRNLPELWARAAEVAADTAGLSEVEQAPALRMCALLASIVQSTGVIKLKDPSETSRLLLAITLLEVPAVDAAVRAAFQHVRALAALNLARLLADAARLVTDLTSYDLVYGNSGLKSKSKSSTPDSLNINEMMYLATPEVLLHLFDFVKSFTEDLADPEASVSFMEDPMSSVGLAALNAFAEYMEALTSVRRGLRRQRASAETSIRLSFVLSDLVRATVGKCLLPLLAHRDHSIRLSVLRVLAAFSPANTVRPGEQPSCYIEVIDLESEIMETVKEAVASYTFDASFSEKLTKEYTQQHLLLSEPFPALSADAAPMGSCPTFRTLLHVEALPNTLVCERARAAALRQLGALAAARRLPPLEALATLNLCLGLLFVKFQPVWTPATEAAVAVCTLLPRTGWARLSETLYSVSISRDDPKRKSSSTSSAAAGRDKHNKNEAVDLKGRSGGNEGNSARFGNARVQGVSRSQARLDRTNSCLVPLRVSQLASQALLSSLSYKSYLRSVSGGENAESEQDWHARLVRDSDAISLATSVASTALTTADARLDPLAVAAALEPGFPVLQARLEALAVAGVTGGDAAVPLAAQRAKRSVRALESGSYGWSLSIEDIEAQDTRKDIDSDSDGNEDDNAELSERYNRAIEGGLEVHYRHVNDECMLGLGAGGVVDPETAHKLVLLLLKSASEIAESRTKVLVPVFLSFLRDDFYGKTHADDPDRQELGLDTLLKSLSLVDSEKEKEREKEKEEKAIRSAITGALLPLAPRSADSANSDFQRTNAWILRRVVSQGDLRSRAKLTKLNAQKRLLSYLSLFAAFTNWDGVALCQALLQVLLRLLQKPEGGVARAALDVIHAMRLNHLLPYKSVLDRLMHDSQFRDEMVAFPLALDRAAMAADHREGLVSVIVRILMGRLSIRKGRTKRDSPAARRAAVLSYLGGLESQEAVVVLYQALRVFLFKFGSFQHHFQQLNSTYYGATKGQPRQYIDGDRQLYSLLAAIQQPNSSQAVRELVDSISASFAPIEGADPLQSRYATASRVVGVLNLMKDLVKQLGQKLRPYVPLLLGVVLAALREVRVVASSLPEEEETPVEEDENFHFDEDEEEDENDEKHHEDSMDLDSEEQKQTSLVYKAREIRSLAIARLEELLSQFPSLIVEPFYPLIRLCLSDAVDGLPAAMRSASRPSALLDFLVTCAGLPHLRSIILPSSFQSLESKSNDEFTRMQSEGVLPGAVAAVFGCLSAGMPGAEGVFLHHLKDSLQLFQGHAEHKILSASLSTSNSHDSKKPSTLMTKETTKSSGPSLLVLTQVFVFVERVLGIDMHSRSMGRLRLLQVSTTTDSKTDEKGDKYKVVKKEYHTEQAREAAHLASLPSIEELGTAGPHVPFLLQHLAIRLEANVVSNQFSAPTISNSSTSASSPTATTAKDEKYWEEEEVIVPKLRAGVKAFARRQLTILSRLADFLTALSDPRTREQIQGEAGGKSHLIEHVMRQMSSNASVQRLVFLLLPYLRLRGSQPSSNEGGSSSKEDTSSLVLSVLTRLVPFLDNPMPFVPFFSYLLSPGPRAVTGSSRASLVELLVALVSGVDSSRSTENAVANTDLVLSSSRTVKSNRTVSLSSDGETRLSADSPLSGFLLLRGLNAANPKRLSELDFDAVVDACSVVSSPQFIKATFHQHTSSTPDSTDSTLSKKPLKKTNESLDVHSPNVSGMQNVGLWVALPAIVHQLMFLMYSDDMSVRTAAQSTLEALVAAAKLAMEADWARFSAQLTSGGFNEEALAALNAGRSPSGPLFKPNAMRSSSSSSPPLEGPGAFPSAPIEIPVVSSLRRSVSALNSLGISTPAAVALHLTSRVLMQDLLVSLQVTSTHLRRNFVRLLSDVIVATHSWGALQLPAEQARRIAHDNRLLPKRHPPSSVAGANRGGSATLARLDAMLSGEQTFLEGESGDIVARGILSLQYHIPEAQKRVFAGSAGLTLTPNTTCVVKDEGDIEMMDSKDGENKDDLQLESVLESTSLSSSLDKYVVVLHVPSLLRDLAPLMNPSDPENEPFSNLLHLQVHKRTQAVADLGELASYGFFSAETTDKFVVPTLLHSIFDESAIGDLPDDNKARSRPKRFDSDGKRVKGSKEKQLDARRGQATSLHAQCVHCVGILASQMSWTAYLRLFRKFTKLIHSLQTNNGVLSNGTAGGSGNKGLERVLVRAVAAMADSFRYSVRTAFFQPNPDMGADLREFSLSGNENAFLAQLITAIDTGSASGARDFTKLVHTVGETVGEDQALDEKKMDVDEEVVLDADNEGSIIDDDDDDDDDEDQEHREKTFMLDLLSGGFQSESVKRVPVSMQLELLRRQVLLQLCSSVLPALLRLLHRQSPSKTKLRKEKSYEKGELRPAVALSIVRLLQQLPGPVMTAEVPHLIAEVVSSLRSREQTKRDAARGTLAKVSVGLGPSFLRVLLREVGSSLTEGYQVHVVGHTVHAVLEAMQESLRPAPVVIDKRTEELLLSNKTSIADGDEAPLLADVSSNPPREAMRARVVEHLEETEEEEERRLMLQLRAQRRENYNVFAQVSDSVDAAISEQERAQAASQGLEDALPTLLELLTRDLFGESAEARSEGSGYRPSQPMAEARTSKSPDSFELLGRVIPFLPSPAIHRVTAPLIAALEHERALGATTTGEIVRLLFKRLTVGLLHNPSVSGPYLLLYVHSIVAEFLHISAAAASGAFDREEEDLANMRRARATPTASLTREQLARAQESLGHDEAVDIYARVMRQISNTPGVNARRMGSVKQWLARDRGAATSQLARPRASAFAAEADRMDLRIEDVPLTAAMQMKGAAPRSGADTFNILPEPKMTGTGRYVSSASSAANRGVADAADGPMGAFALGLLQGALLRSSHNLTAATLAARNNNNNNNINNNNNNNNNNNETIQTQTGIVFMGELFIRRMLDPFVPLLLKLLQLASHAHGATDAVTSNAQSNTKAEELNRGLTISSGLRQDSVVARALRVLGCLLPLPLPSLRRLARKVPPVVLSFVASSAGQRNASGSLELASAALRTATTMLSRCEYVRLSEEQTRALVTVAHADISLEPCHSASYALLRAVVARQLVLPELYDCMRSIARLVLQAPTAPARTLAASSILHFLLSYPMTDSLLEELLALFVSNLGYAREEGRLAVLSLLGAVITRFPTPVLDAAAPTLLLPLVLRMSEDTSARCRVHAQALIGRLFGRLSPTAGRTMLSLPLQWTRQGQKSGNRRAGYQTLLAAVEGAPQLLENTPQLLVLALSNATVEAVAAAVQLHTHELRLLRELDPASEVEDVLMNEKGVIGTEKEEGERRLLRNAFQQQRAFSSSDSATTAAISVDGTIRFQEKIEEEVDDTDFIASALASDRVSDELMTQKDATGERLRGTAGSLTDSFGVQAGEVDELADSARLRSNQVESDKLSAFLAWEPLYHALQFAERLYSTLPAVCDSSIRGSLKHFNSSANLEGADEENPHEKARSALFAVISAAPGDWKPHADLTPCNVIAAALGVLRYPHAWVTAAAVRLLGAFLGHREAETFNSAKELALRGKEAAEVSVLLSKFARIPSVADDDDDHKGGSTDDEGYEARREDTNELEEEVTFNSLLVSAMTQLDPPAAFLADPEIMYLTAMRHIQLLSLPGLSSSLGEQISRNLLFLLNSLSMVLPLEVRRADVPLQPTNDSSSSTSEGTASIKMNPDVSTPVLPEERRRDYLWNLLVKCTTVASFHQTSRSAILRVLCALFMSLDESLRPRYAQPPLRLLYRLTVTEAESSAPSLQPTTPGAYGARREQDAARAAARALADEAVDIFTELLGAPLFVQMFQQERARSAQQRIERRKARAVMRIVDPDAAAAERARRNSKKALLRKMKLEGHRALKGKISKPVKRPLSSDVVGENNKKYRLTGNHSKGLKDKK